MKTSQLASTFGIIYQKALKSQLQKMGGKLCSIREARKENISNVAVAINLRPELLTQIENGQHDFRIKTLFALCQHYNIDVESIIGKGELLHFHFQLAAN